MASAGASSSACPATTAASLGAPSSSWITVSEQKPSSALISWVAG